MSDTPRHHPKKLERMQKRYEDHGSLRKVAEEFEMSKSHAHRLLKDRAEEQRED